MKVEYTSIFYHLATSAKSMWDDDIMVFMYWCGLEPQIATDLNYNRVPTLDDVVHIMYQVEENSKRVPF